MEILGKRLKSTMEKYEITVSDLAEYCGRSEKIVSNWRNGTTDPTAENLKNICKCLGVSSEYLLGLTDTEEIEIFEDISNEIGLSVEAVTILHYYNEVKKIDIDKESKNPLDYLLSFDVMFEFLELLEKYFQNDTEFNGSIILNDNSIHSTSQNNFIKKENERKVTFSIIGDSSNFKNSLDINALDLKSLQEKNIIKCLSSIHESITHLEEKEKAKAKELSKESTSIPSINEKDEVLKAVYNFFKENPNEIERFKKWTNLTDELRIVEKEYAKNTEKK